MVPYGKEVPTMVVDGLAAPIRDSLEISYWLCTIYPKLLPQSHEVKIRTWLSELHAIEGLSLSAARPEQPKEDIVDDACDELLADTDSSDEYRRALEYKKEV